MAIPFSLTLLLFSLITTAALRHSSAAETPSPSPATAPPPSIPEKQLKNIFDALVGAGDFGGWANLLSSANPAALTLTATLFIPSNDAITRLISTGAHFDPLLILYHIVPQRLTFAELRQFVIRTRLPTLIPSKFIVVTNNSASNFTLDGARVVQGDMFLNAAFALHGTDKILDYSDFGDGDDEVRISPALSPEKAKGNDTGEGERPVGPDCVKSGVGRSSAGIMVIVLVFLGVVF